VLESLVLLQYFPLKNLAFETTTPSSEITEAIAHGMGINISWNCMFDTEEHNRHLQQDYAVFESFKLDTSYSRSAVSF